MMIYLMRFRLEHGGGHGGGGRCSMVEEEEKKKIEGDEVVY